MKLIGTQFPCCVYVCTRKPTLLASIQDTTSNCNHYAVLRTPELTQALTAFQCCSTFDRTPLHTQPFLALCSGPPTPWSCPRPAQSHFYQCCPEVFGYVTAQVCPHCTCCSSVSWLFSQLFFQISFRIGSFIFTQNQNTVVIH
jgi:hypothetical protein